MKSFNALTRRQKTAWIIAGAALMIAALAGVWLISGGSRQVVVNNDIVSSLPEPETAAPLAPIGDSRADRAISVSVYYADDTLSRLKPTVRSVTISSDMTLEEAVARAVMDEPGEDGLRTLGASDIQILSVEVSRGIATVDLSIDARRLDAQRMHMLRAALVNSLLDTGNVSAVNVLIDGCEECILQLPAGAMGRFDCDLNAVWQAALDEEAGFTGSASSDALERTATLYFGSSGGEYLLPETHRLSVSGGDYLGAIISELMRGPDDTNDCARLLPSSSQYMREAPEIITSSDGSKIAVISLKGAAGDYFDRNGISTAQAFGSMTRSICGFVPNVDGVLYDIDGIVVNELYDSQGRLMYTFADGIMRRSDFDSLVGDTATLYYPASDCSAVVPVCVAMPRYDVDNPRALLKLLMQQPLSAGLSRATPDIVTDADALGVRVENDQVLINLSGAFYQACQGLTSGRARTMVYAIVNTMCQMDGISGVRFYFDGERVESLASTISMRGPLMYNGGIVRAEP